MIEVRPGDVAQLPGGEASILVRYAGRIAGVLTLELAPLGGFGDPVPSTRLVQFMKQNGLKLRDVVPAVIALLNGDCTDVKAET
jgi:hypothetical protein